MHKSQDLFWWTLNIKESVDLCQAYIEVQVTYKGLLIWTLDLD